MRWHTISNMGCLCILIFTLLKMFLIRNGFKYSLSNYIKYEYASIFKLDCKAHWL